VARFIRKGDVLSVHVGRLEPAKVTGIGTLDPQLWVRTSTGFFRRVASIDDKHARSVYLTEYAELCEWVVKQAQLGRA